MGIELTVMSLDLDSNTTPETSYFDKDEITLGRYDWNDVVLNKPEVSGEHVRLRVKQGENGDPALLYVTDLGSSNGTMVESTALKPYEEIQLRPNARLIIGTYIVKPSPKQEARKLTPKAIRLVEGGEEEYMPIHSEAVQPPTAPVHEHQEEKEEVVEISAIPETRQVEFIAEEETLAPEIAEEGPLAPERKPAAEILNFDFEAIQLFSLKGKVLHRGSPLLGVEIDAGDIGKTTTDHDGCFSFADIPEDTSYCLSAKKSDFVFEISQANGVLNSDITAEFAAFKLVNISGKVTHKGKPLAGVEIDAGALGKTITGPDGSYIFENVREDTPVKLTAVKTGFRFSPGR